MHVIQDSSVADNLTADHLDDIDDVKLIAPRKQMVAFRLGQLASTDKCPEEREYM